MKQKPNNSNGWEQSVEYWVYQASKGENIAKCWQNIKKFISSELQRERERIFKDLIKIADAGELEDLRREVTRYFKQK